MIIERGNIFLTNLEPVEGSEQGKVRPCLVIQNNLGNKVSPITIVAAITSQIEREFPFTVFVRKGEANLQKNSLVLCNHLRSVSVEDRVIKKIGSLKPSTIKKVDLALKTSLSLE
ncbi:type II toxin-antitoxin system PemK/MazF family toxin [Candidatus Micrarchaeota archaeon]|nr:type II toxin-antitoxin system PemK/MazF family toxin [Candidatus Micrarchaeota archaeon]MBU2476653.1 type II toxin-antitoxin system PemK/MazF family toxin [Candidatus Micrarchaeota archaeon]